MRVGRAVENSMIVIERPSPGDDYWYRLPHTISVQGALPEGVQLVQKGSFFHELARFEGVPTRAGTYAVTLQATMADGLKTEEVPVVFNVEEPGAFAYVAAIPWGRTRFVSGEPIQGEAVVSIVTEQGAFEDDASGEVYALQVSGLPPGLTYEKQRGGGFYLLTGDAPAEGTYPVLLQWGLKDGAPMARAEVNLEILPSGYVPGKRALVNYNPRPLKKAARYEEGQLQTATFLVQDDLGRNLQEGFKLVAEGLPQGLTLENPRSGAGAGFVGSPRESGTFNVRVKAVFEDGSESEAAEYTLQVEASVELSLAVGSYDCLLGRSAELNDNNGGRLLVTLGRKGALSGYLLNNFKRYPFSSRDAELNLESGEVTIVPQGAGVKFSGWVEEDTQGYSSPEKPVFVLRGVLSDTAGQNSLGVYAMGATPKARGDSSRYASPHPINLMVVPGSPFDATQPVAGAPVGIGFSALRISSSGLVSATVWAADGSAPVTTSTRLCETSGSGARFSTHFVVTNSSGRSSLQGALFVNEAGDAAGQMDWFQNASDRGAFPDGIPLVQYEGVIGSRMAPQPSGLNLEGFEEGVRNAELDFIGVDGESEDVLPLTVDKKSIVPALLAAAPSAQAGPTTSNVRMRYNAKTGVLTGSLVWTDGTTGTTRPVSFRGMRAPDGKAVMGHFTAPEGGGSKKLEAGQILLQPAR
jgi:hypothetical protein